MSTDSRLRHRSGDVRAPSSCSLGGGQDAWSTQTVASGCVPPGLLHSNSQRVARGVGTA